MTQMRLGDLPRPYNWWIIGCKFNPGLSKFEVCALAPDTIEHKYYKNCNKNIIVQISRGLAQRLKHSILLEVEEERIQQNFEEILIVSCHYR